MQLLVLTSTIGAIESDILLILHTVLIVSTSTCREMEVVVLDRHASSYGVKRAFYGHLLFELSMLWQHKRLSIKLALNNFCFYEQYTQTLCLQVDCLETSRSIHFAKTGTPANDAAIEIPRHISVVVPTILARKTVNPMATLLMTRNLF